MISRKEDRFRCEQKTSQVQERHSRESKLLQIETGSTTYKSKDISIQTETASSDILNKEKTEVKDILPKSTTKESKKKKKSKRQINKRTSILEATRIYREEEVM